MLTAILVILCVELFFRLAQTGNNLSIMKTLERIEMNTRGYGK